MNIQNMFNHSGKRFGRQNNKGKIFTMPKAFGSSTISFGNLQD